MDMPMFNCNCSSKQLHAKTCICFLQPFVHAYTINSTSIQEPPSRGLETACVVVPRSTFPLKDHECKQGQSLRGLKGLANALPMLLFSPFFFCPFSLSAGFMGGQMGVNGKHFYNYFNNSYYNNNYNLHFWPNIRYFHRFQIAFTRRVCMLKRIIADTRTADAYAPGSRITWKCAP